MIKTGSKQQRDVAKRTKQLKNDIRVLVQQYEQEIGLEVSTLSCVKDNSYGMPTYDIAVQVQLPNFIDEEE